MARKIEHCGDIDNAIEQGRYGIASLPSSMFSKNKDLDRDKEVKDAISNLNYMRVHDEIVDIVRYTLEEIHNNARYKQMITMPHYAKITEDVIKDIYKKHYC